MTTPTHLAALFGGPDGVPDVLAYIGPGAGLGALILAIALVLGVVLLVIGLVWYPLKRVFRARTANLAAGGRDDEPG